MVKKLYRYRLALKNNQHREGLIIQDGERFGEIAPLPGFSKETLKEAEQEALNWIETDAPPTLPSVRFGIDSLQIELHSIKLPLASLGVKEGFTTQKLKLGHLSLQEAIDLVKKQSSKARIRLDCNRAWSLKQALEFASHFTSNDFIYLEEPVQSVEELIEFSKLTNFPIALDESIDTDFSKIPSLKAIVVKPTVVGTIPSIPKHLDLVLSASYESGLGLLHIAHLAKGNLPVGLDTYDALEEDLLINPIQTKNGIFSWKKSEPILNINKLCAF